MGRRKMRLVEDTLAQSIWQYLEGYRLRHGYSPTYREIAEATHCAITAARAAVSRLMAAGVVTSAPGISRTLVPTQQYRMWKQQQRYKSSRRHTSPPEE